MSERPKTPGFLQLRIRWKGLVVAAGTLACISTAAGFLASTGWPLELFSHFRCQYLVGLLCCAAVVYRQPRWSVFFLIFALVNVPLVAPRYFGAASTEGNSVQPIRVLLSNVHTRYGSEDQVASLIDDVQADILVLQEVNARWLAELEPHTASYAESMGDARADNFGIALYSKFPMLSRRSFYLGKANVPTIIATLDVEPEPITVVATHPLPPTNPLNAAARDEQLQLVADVVRDLDTPVLLVGDLNCTPWSPTFAALLERSGLRDSGKGFGVQPSWPAWFPPLMIPIDHCLHSRELVVLERRLGAYVGSDHLPLIVDFQFEE